MEGYKAVASEKSKLSLAAKIAAISAEIGQIEKTGQNAAQRYMYIESGEISARVRQAQNEYGVAIIPQITDHSCTEHTTAKGQISFQHTLNMKFTVINTDNPEERFEATWVSEATDYGDKGVNKAATAGEKYFLIRLYHISEKGEQDADADTPDPVMAPKPVATKTKASAGTPKPKIDFKRLKTIREQIKTIDNVDKLTQYWSKLKLDQRSADMLVGDFKKRKQEIQQDGA